MQTTKQTLELTIGDLKALRLVAKRLGFTIGRGIKAKEGSIRKLNEAIARGDVGVTIVADKDESNGNN